MSGFVLQLLAGEDELGVFEEEFFPVQERLEDVGRELEGVWVCGGEGEHEMYEIRRPKAEIRRKSEGRRSKWRGRGGRIGLRGSGGGLGAQRVFHAGWD